MKNQTSIELHAGQAPAYIANTLVKSLTDSNVKYLSTHHANPARELVEYMRQSLLGAIGGIDNER